MGHMDTKRRSISAHMAETAPDDVAEGYMRGLDRQIARTPEYLNRIDIKTLRQPGNRLIVLREDGRVIAGLYTTPSTDRDRSVTWYNGLYSHCLTPGVAAHLIAEALRRTVVDDQAKLMGARVRVMPCGRVNAPAARAFARHGFYPESIHRYQIAANPLDEHLYPSAESDGATYRALTLIARPQDLRPALWAGALAE